MHDQILEGPDRLEHARKILFEGRAACSDPDETDLLTSIISGLEKSATSIVHETAYRRLTRRGRSAGTSPISHLSSTTRLREVQRHGIITQGCWRTENDGAIVVYVPLSLRFFQSYGATGRSCGL